MVPWWGWAILAAALAFLEMHAPGGYLIWIALGAAVTAGIDAVCNLSATIEIVTVTVASGLSCIIGYFVYRRVDRFQSSEPTLNQRNALVVGERGIVCTDIVHGEGKIRLGDTVWLAEGPDLPTGTAVIVKSVRGSRARVMPVDTVPHAEGMSSA
jgi:hypothetical protein